MNKFTRTLPKGHKSKRFEAIKVRKKITTNNNKIFTFAKISGANLLTKKKTDNHQHPKKNHIIASFK
jgi:hypothetical protein